MEQSEKELAFAAKYKKPMQWVSVKDNLPEIDQYVLWLHENGFIFHEAIDKDWSPRIVKYFLAGRNMAELMGPITHWMLPELPTE